MTEQNGVNSFDMMVADAVERRLGSLVGQNQCAMDVFIALLARQRAAGVNDPVIHITAEERRALMGQTVSFTSYPNGDLKIYTPGSAHAPDETLDWNKQEVMPQALEITEHPEPANEPEEIER